MEVNPSHTYLLGRPLIHMVRVMPSTLHQKVKFMVEEKLISVAIEEDMIVATTVTTPYIKVSKKAIECSFQSLEVINATFVGEGSRVKTPHLSKMTQMEIK